MANVPTYEDVKLILKLYDLRREEKLRQARAWFGDKFWVRTVEEFHALCPEGSESNAYFRMVVTYWDMAASFVTSGVLHQELFLESGNELLYVYEKTKSLLGPWREFMGNPKVMSNLETVAKAAILFMNRANPDAYATWSAMLAKTAESKAAALKTATT